MGIVFVLVGLLKVWRGRVLRDVFVKKYRKENCVSFEEILVLFCSWGFIG